VGLSKSFKHGTWSKKGLLPGQTSRRSHSGSRCRASSSWKYWIHSVHYITSVKKILSRKNLSLSNDNQISWQHSFLCKPNFVQFSTLQNLEPQNNHLRDWLNNWKQISVKCLLCNNLCILDIWKSTPTPKRKAGGSDFHPKETNGFSSHVSQKLLPF